MKDFELNSRGNQLDVLASQSGHQTQASELPTLNVSALRSVSRQIKQISKDEFQIVLSNNTITASSIVNKLKGSNCDIYDVVYSEDLEDEELVNVSSKPLWSVNKAGNVIQLKRVHK